MRSLPLTLLALCLVIGAEPGASPAAAAPPAEVIDAALMPGDTFCGVIDAIGDHDLITFPGASGDHITVTVTAMPGSSLKPELWMTNEDYALEIDTATGKTARISITPDISADWQFRISGNGTTGAYRARVRSQSGSYGRHGLVYAGAEPGSVKLDFAAIGGSRLRLTARPAHGSQALAGTPVVNWPGVLDLSASIVVEGKTLKIKDAPLLPGFAKYNLTVPNAGAPGELKLKARIHRPKPVHQTFFEP